MKVLIDTNVIIDFLVNREPYAKEAVHILELCSDKKIEGHIAAHTISNLFFILRKNYSISHRKEMISALCNIFEISSIDKNKIIQSTLNDSFNDFEDCLQFECAKEVNADYIITRNPSDFINSSIKVIEPKDFLSSCI